MLDLAAHGEDHIERGRYRCWTETTRDNPILRLSWWSESD